jgi:hypothetical protein
VRQHRLKTRAYTSVALTGRGAIIADSAPAVNEDPFAVSPGGRPPPRLAVTRLEALDSAWVRYQSRWMLSGLEP